MRIASYTVYGGPETIAFSDAPIPRPALGEVLIRVRAAPVTAGDARLRSGMVPRGLLSNRAFASEHVLAPIIFKKGIDMQAGNVSSSHTSYLFRTSSAVTKDRSVTSSGTLSRSIVATSSQVSISQEALAAASKAKQSGAPHTFDFTHMSQNELQGAAKKLFEDGKISGLDMAVFQRFGRVLGNAGPNGELVELSLTERASADSAPKNIVALLKEQMESKIASPEALSFYKRMDAALSKIGTAHG